MNPDLPSARCREMVDGGIMSWPCSLPFGHTGPHEAIEVPSSSTRRKRWMEENPVPSEASAIKGTDADIAGSIFRQETAPSEMPVLKPASINEDEQRLAAIMRLLTKTDLSALPSPVASWVMGMMAQTSLLALWEMAMKEFQSGATGVVITPEYLNRVVPQSLRTYLGRQ